MRVVVTGGTGSIGRRLVPALLQRGDDVALVTRRPREVRRLFGGSVEVLAGDCTCPGPWQGSVDGSDAVVHLAGASVADKRWNSAYRDLIERSRIDSTFQVVRAIEDARRRPTVLVAASATGYYGNAGAEYADERFPPGRTFLADLCVRWETEARKAEPLLPRVVRARIGLVLDDEGPTLRRMLPWFRNGLGAILGNGRQYMPWIHHGDCTGAILRALDRPTLNGPLNITAPDPCQQRVFARALGRTLGRPVFLRAPRFALRLAFGGIADELFSSQRAIPRALVDDGFTFRASTIEECFELLAHDESSAPKRPTVAPGTAMVAASLPKPAMPPARPRLLIVSESLCDDGQGRPRPGMREAVRAASSHGCAVVVASDRPGPSLTSHFVDPLLHPVAIAANGAVLWAGREAKPAYAERLELSTLAALVLAIRRLAPLATLVFEGEDWIASDVDAPEGFGPVTLRITAGELPPKPTVRLHVVGDATAVSAARSAIEGPFWRERKITLVQRQPRRLTVASPLVDRAVAAQRIARRIGAAREETMAMVAVEEDLGLADWCGFSVAASTAPPGVRRLAGATLPEGSEAGDALGAVVRSFIAKPP